MTPTSAIRFLVRSAAVAATLLACSFTRSLDYLTAGAGGDVEAGEAGVAADAAEARDGGLPADTVAPAQLGPRNLAQDDANLYWSNADGAIMTVPKQGGAARKIASAPPGEPVRWIAPDPGADGDLWLIAGPAVYRVSKGGGEVQLVEKENPRPHALAVDEDYLFVAHFDLNAADFGRLVRFSKREPANRTVLSDEADDPSALALHRGSIFWSGLTLDGSSVVFELPRDAPAGTTPKTYRSGPSEDDEVYVDSATAFAVDEEAIYYTEDDVLYRLLRSQEATRSAVFSPPREASLAAFAFDGASLYVLDEREKGAIVRVPKSGGEMRAIATNQPVPTAVVVDLGFVYFTVQGSGYEPDGAVLRAAK